jgi:choline dehydrogenase-like flavoprotein
MSLDDYPDVQLFLASASDNSDGGLFGKRGCGLEDDFFANLFEENLYKDTYTAIPLVLRPRSRGYVKLRSADPRQPPLIVPNYFHDPRDLDVLVRTIRPNGLNSGSNEKSLRVDGKLLSSSAPREPKFLVYLNLALQGLTI